MATDWELLESIKGVLEVFFQISFVHHFDSITIIRPHTLLCKLCRLKQCQCWAVPLQVSNFSWLSRNDWAKNILNYDIGHGSVCTGHKSITSRWTTPMAMSSPWASLHFLITQSLNHTMDIRRLKSSILPYTAVWVGEYIKRAKTAMLNIVSAWPVPYPCVNDFP
jgi:hypothetical protein